MKMNQLLALTLVLISTVFASSCRLYQTESHTYTVDIEILESPEASRLIDLGHQEKIRVEFTSDVEIGEAHVLLFSEDANMFDIEGDNVQAKETVRLTDPMVQGEMDNDAIFAARNSNVEAMEYTFEQEVDLSIYPTGTCFVLYGIARPDYSFIGYNTESVYFCKKN